MTPLLLVDSHTTELPEFVNGYYFDDIDFHFDWSAPTGPRSGGPLPRTGLDGAYVVARHTSTGAQIGVDYDGNRRLFLYRHGDYAAVSDSLMGLAEAIRGAGRRLTVLDEQLQAWAGGGAFLEQMATYQSVFAEIQLVPQDLDVELVTQQTSAGLRHDIRLVARDLGRFPNDAPTYHDALSEYVDVWLGRYATLLADERTTVTVDLSGGLDSRVAFGFAANVVDAAPDLRQRLRVFSQHRRADDLRVATEALSVLGFGPPVACRRSGAPMRSNVESRYDHWVRNRLGQYYLGRTLPTASPDIGTVLISGLGGEKYRPFYHKWFDSLRQLVRRRKRHFADDAAFARFRRDVFRSMELELPFPAAAEDLLIRHYRQFRSRFHWGCPAAEKIRIGPVAGGLLDRVAERAGSDRIANRQIYFDVLASTQAGLLDLPFDQPAKAPSADNRARLTTVKADAPSPGEVFVHRVFPSPSNSDSDQTGIEFLRERYEAALKSVPPGIRPDDDRVRAIFDDAKGESFEGTEKTMLPIHTVLLVDACARLAS